MIRTFRSQSTERLFRREKGCFPATLEHLMLRKLLILDSAVQLGDLRVQAIKTLSGGSHKGYHRICIVRKVLLYTRTGGSLGDTVFI